MKKPLVVWNSLIGFIILLLLPFFYLTALQAEDNIAKLIYAEKQQSVYQILVLNQLTGKKSTIGSAFVIQKKDLLATNYHVISSYINDPDTYNLEYLAINGRRGKLEVLDIDVIHDLALLRSDKQLGHPLDIAAIPAQGASLYSMGNPKDQGFSINKGTNNGIMPQSEDSRILFSGNLNPGMSGGPTFNDNKQLIGINVATAGEGLSFLVPAKYLTALLKKLEARQYQAITNFHDHITQQILAYQQQYVNGMIQRDWSVTETGQFITPAEMARSIRCWDSGRPTEAEDLYQTIFTRCANEYDIYLSSELTIGSLLYEYLWIETEDLNPTRFYKHYEKLFSSWFESDATEKDVSDFACHTGFVSLGKQDFKINICRRDYLRYSGLSDVMVMAAMIGKKDKGFLFNMDMSGVDFKSSMKLLQKVLGAFQWQN